MTLLPLEGITVVSIEQAVAAPFATRQLADLGARVVKIERPGSGDFARRYDTTVNGEASYFVWLNRSKQSVTLDIKNVDGRQILDLLLADADVLVHNLGPGAADRLGLVPDRVNAAFPTLIVCGITGFGSNGAWAGRKAYDLLVQCETGLVSLTGTPEDPAKVGISIADIAAGMYAYSGILTSLFVRARTGRAPAVEVSLFDALAEWMAQPALYTRYGGQQPSRHGIAHATIAPYGPYRVGDGRVIVLAIQHDDEWCAFCETVLGRMEVATDSRFRTNPDRVRNRAILDRIILERFASATFDEVRQLLDKAGIANAGLNDVRAFLDHPVLAERGRWRTVATAGGEVQALSPPARLSGVDTTMGPVPALGQHTDMVLGSLGISEHEITRLRSAGIV